MSSAWTKLVKYRLLTFGTLIADCLIIPTSPVKEMPHQTQTSLKSWVEMTYPSSKHIRKEVVFQFRPLLARVPHLALLSIDNDNLNPR
jgi:hypothetical protein